MKLGKIPKPAGWGRRSGVRGIGLIAVAGVATIGVGIGIAYAQDNSPRAHALRAAAAQASGMPSAKARLFTEGVAHAFPSQPADKPVHPTVGPAPAPGVARVTIPDNRAAGISSLRQAPFAPVDFSVQNSYSALIRGRWYIAYAGTTGGDEANAGQGAIRVMSAGPGANTDLKDLGTFASPGTASLKITSHTGTAITLATDTGSSVTFDLSTLGYR